MRLYIFTCILITFNDWKVIHRNSSRIYFKKTEFENNSDKKFLDRQFLVNTLFTTTGLCSAVRSKSDYRSRGCEFDPGMVVYFHGH